MSQPIRVREVKGPKGGQFAPIKRVKPTSGGGAKSLYVEAVEKKGGEKK
jgi:hypothetical protein